jgi:hypothetical protein
MGAELHGREGDVAGSDRQDADANSDALGCRKDRGRLRDSTAEAEVLNNSELVEAELVGSASEWQHCVGRKIPRKHDTYGTVLVTHRDDSSGGCE